MNEYEVITELLLINKRLVKAIIKYCDLMDTEGGNEFDEIQQRLQRIQRNRL